MNFSNKILAFVVDPLCLTFQPVGTLFVTTSSQIRPQRANRYISELRVALFAYQCNAVSVSLSKQYVDCSYPGYTEFFQKYQFNPSTSHW